MKCVALKRLLWPLALCLLALVARCWNLADVFVDGRIYFVDADCYSRMTRAAMVAGGRGLVIRHHDFENFPHGVTPHTTAPLDWLIVGEKRILDFGFQISDFGKTSVLRGQTLDLAGALVSPLLGALTCAWIAWWARRQDVGCAWTAPALFAVSPILVHGTVLGRPDHQSLLILLLAIALGAEWELRLRGIGASRACGIVAGCAWALALWVSFYEPLVLLGFVLLLWCLGDRRRFTARECRAGWIVFAAVLCAAALIDGWRASWPGAAFRAWQTTIGELRHLDWRSMTLLRWLGATCVVTPLLLRMANRKSQMTIMAVLLLLLALTLWQVRWSYFLALAYAMSLPWQLAALPRAWIGGLIFVLGLWPVARDWEAALFPEGAAAKARVETRAERVQLREVAAAMRGERAGFLAPWWLSPALAYWSGQPGVAGSSHEALPGTMETARFFLAPSAAEAEAIARRLGVRWIVTDGADEDGVSRLVKAYGPLLGGAVPAAPWGVAMHERGRPRERVSSEDLKDALPALRAKLLAVAERAQAEELGSAAFSCVFTNSFFKLFRVAASGDAEAP